MKRRLLSVLVVVGLCGASTTAWAARTDSDHGWEVALAHKHTLVAANATLKLVAAQSRAKGLKAVIERDGKGDFEVAITGFTTQKAAAAARAQARAGFPTASIEGT